MATSLLLFVVPQLSECLPVDTVSFVSENGGRGTLSLLLSCLLTLFLCVYTAVHLNVPPRNERPSKTRAREFWWCLIGLFGPELVVLAAWRQWSSAKALGLEIKTLQCEVEAADTKSKSIEFCVPRNPWTLTHGFYAGMGGFAFDPDEVLDDHEKDVFGGLQRITLTARGVLLLVKCGLVPDISEDDIKDKSKADRLAKLIVCLQAGWMFVQVVSRLAADLPVTLIEVNTLGHVACALLMYLLWWSKPRQVKEPTILKGDWVKSLGVFMYIASRVSGRKGERRAILGPHYLPPAIVCRQEDHTSLPDIVDETIKNSRSDHVNISTSYSIIPAYGESDRSHQFELAAQAISQYKAVRARFSMQDAKRNVLTGPGEDLVSFYSSNWPTDQLLRTWKGLLMGMALWAATIVYGAVHTAAWNAYYPSKAEEWLWHASSIWVAVSGVIWVAINFIAAMCPPIDVFWVKFNKRKTHYIWDVIIGFLCLGCGLAYVSARAYLVIEAFISIRRLPKEAYDTPAWIQVLPHL